MAFPEPLVWMLAHQDVGLLRRGAPVLVELACGMGFEVRAWLVISNPIGHIYGGVIRGERESENRRTLITALKDMGTLNC